MSENEPLVARPLVRIAGKRLTAVDLPGRGSNQHELNGVSQLRDLFGDSRRAGAVTWLQVHGEGEGVTPSEGRFTWYDAREQHPTRTEYRLYYDSGAPLDNAAPEDFLFLLTFQRGHTESIWGLIAPGQSSVGEQLCWVLGLDPDNLGTFVTPDPALVAGRMGRFEFQELWETIGLLDLQAPFQPSDSDRVTRRFGESFPSTAEMSAFAREVAPADGRSTPDRALVQWLEQEERLFRALEERAVRRQLEKGFEGVDHFVSFSLSVQNRRKSRMGRALENHLRQIFDDCGVKYAYQPVTEHRSRPDFLFPGAVEYHSETWPSDKRYVLAAKSTCKDRWRQVLSEAQRIPRKHLCTLEPGISETQIAEMRAHDVQLVVPEPVLESYRPNQRPGILTLSGFVDLVR